MTNSYWHGFMDKFAQINLGETSDEPQTYNLLLPQSLQQQQGTDTNINKYLSKYLSTLQGQPNQFNELGSAMLPGFPGSTPVSMPGQQPEEEQ